MARARMNIATALNSKYMRYTHVMLTSLFMNQPDAEIHVYLLHNDLTEQDQKYLSELAEAYSHTIHFLLIDNTMFSADLPTTSEWTIEAYYRLMLVDILPSDVDRLLYLDVDMIINKPLLEMYSTDFEGNLLCVCKDMGVDSTFPDIIRNEIFKEHIANGYVYFNSGMILWNIEKMRETYNFRYYMDVAKALNYQIFAPDQDLLNYIHWQEVKHLDEYQYNLFARMAFQYGIRYEDVKKETTIIHYTGMKPWSGEYVHFDIEKFWWEYAKLTPFYHELLEEFTLSCVQSPLIYQTMADLSNEKKQLKAELEKSLATCKKLLQMLNA